MISWFTSDIGYVVNQLIRQAFLLPKRWALLHDHQPPVLGWLVKMFVTLNGGSYFLQIIFLCIVFLEDVLEYEARDEVFSTGLKVWIVDCFLPILQVTPCGWWLKGEMGVTYLFIADRFRMVMIFIVWLKILSFSIG